MTPEDEDPTPEARRVFAEVRTCGQCGEPVVYWGGSFRHLSHACAKA